MRVVVNDIDVTNKDLSAYKDILSQYTNRDSNMIDKVLVYLQYFDAASAVKACKAMNGRFFAGKSLKATLSE